MNPYLAGVLIASVCISAGVLIAVRLAFRRLDRELDEPQRRLTPEQVCLLQERERDFGWRD